jgi:hypothetical protein
MIYLASPYSGTPEEMQERYEAARERTADFLSRNFMIYSPIVHCHELAKHHNLPKDFAFWRDYNFHFLALAEQLWVYMLPGWHTSQGVTREVLWWRQNKDTQALHYLTEDGMFDL